MNKQTRNIINVSLTLVAIYLYSFTANNIETLSGTEFCETEHLGMVISGNATIAFENEEPKIIGPGDIFYVSNTPHDSWVVGDEDYVSIHFMGAEKYAD